MGVNRGGFGYSPDGTFAFEMAKSVVLDAHHKYLKQHYNAEWTDATLYHLSINTSLMTIEQAIKTLVTALVYVENGTAQPQPEEQY